MYNNIGLGGVNMSDKFKKVIVLVLLGSMLFSAIASAAMFIM